MYIYIYTFFVFFFFLGGGGGGGGGRGMVPKIESTSEGLQLQVTGDLELGNKYNGGFLSSWVVISKVVTTLNQVISIGTRNITLL